jgi:hypothetical protein
MFQPFLNIIRKHVKYYSIITARNMANYAKHYATLYYTILYYIRLLYYAIIYYAIIYYTII